MKKIQILFLTLATAFLTAACDKDGEMLTVSAPEAASGLSADATEIVLSVGDADNLALTLYWNNGQTPAVSNPDVSLPDDLVGFALQMSAAETFADVYEQTLENGQSSVQFTVAALNSILLRLGLSDEGLHDVYVRLKTRMGSDAVLSDVLRLRISPFVIDVTVMEMQNKDDRSVFATLHSTDATPALYEGFAVASAWQNFFFAAADGTLWGTDASTWTPFTLRNGPDGDELVGNCWFPAAAGCRYIYADTQAGQWIDIHLPKITIAVGETAVDMKFSASTKCWTGIVTTATADAALAVGGTGARYDVETGDSGTPKDTPFTIAANADGTFRFVSGTGETAINAGAAGSYTLTLDVGNATWQIAQGGDVPPAVTYPEALYAYYYYKESSQQLSLATAMAAQETEGSYEGFIYTDPDWGAESSNFRFHTSTDDTATVYATDSSQYELSSGEGIWNLWSANTGLNYVVADLAAMSWSETKVAQIAVSGDFNAWSTSTDVMQYDAATHKWTAVCAISTIGYGFKFVLGDADNAWRWQYGDPDGDGVLVVAGNADNIVPAAVGTYKIELDLSSFTAPTYTLIPQTVE